MSCGINMYESSDSYSQLHPNQLSSSIAENGNDANVYSNQSLADTASETNVAPSSLPQLLHWSEVVYEVENFQVDDWNIAGGSDYGQLSYLIDTGDILLEVEG